MKKNVILIGAVAVSLLCFANIASAAVLTSTEICTGQNFSTYSCVSQFGYSGTDPYGVYKYSRTNPVDGSLHGCTSFAAFMIAKYHPWIPEITHFDAARSWAYDASTSVAGSTVDQSPRVGDIAQWGKPTDLDEGHVAFVEEVYVNSVGSPNGLMVAEDNGGLRRTSSIRIVMKSQPGVGFSWPDNFITFPGSISGGGGTRMNMLGSALDPVVP